MKKILKLILLILPFYFLITGVSAKTPELCDRSNLENYGVNKKWEITSSNKTNVENAPCVNAEDKIYDFAGKLTDEEYRILKIKIDEYIQKTNMDLVIVIDSIPYNYDRVNEDYAADFYDYNDFGMMNDNYSGTLLLRNTYDQDPYYNIYTFGEAQLYYDYDRLEYILDAIYPEIHSARYFDGFSKFIDKVDRYYDRGKALKNYKVDENGYLKKKYVYPLLWVLLFSTFTTVIIMTSLIKKNKMVMKATKAKEYIDETTVEINKREDIFLTTHTTSYTTSSSSGSGGGHHSSGGSSGGGHSSGGGRHG